MSSGSPPTFPATPAQEPAPAPLPTPRRLDHLPWPAVAAAAQQPGSTVLWPFGATEQHGPHLPLATDALFAERLAELVLAQLDPALPIWRLPIQALGFSPEHLDFAGTLSLSAPLMIELVVTVGRQLAASGFQRLVLFNAHGGQIGLLEAAARELRQQEPALGVLPCFLWRLDSGFGDLIPSAELEQGLHGGLAETALMQQLAPQLVGPLPAADGLGLEPPPGWSLEGAAPTSWRTSELSASGLIGDPRGATAELGEALEQRLVACWRQRLEALLASDWPPRSGRG